MTLPSEIENINRNLAMGKETVQPSWTARSKSPFPLLSLRFAFVSCSYPMFFLSGVARFLFVPARGSGELCHARFLYVVADDRTDAGRCTLLSSKTNITPKNISRKDGLFRRYQQGFEKRL